MANTVVHVGSIWLTSLERTGDNLDITGEAASINAVANFITQMKRTGYFDKVEIKDAKENDLRPDVSNIQLYDVCRRKRQSRLRRASKSGGDRRSATPATCGEREELAMAMSFRGMALARTGADLRRIGSRSDRSWGCMCRACRLQKVRSDLDDAQATLKPLDTEVQSLRVYKQRRTELQSQMDALQKQLATLQTIVPEEKETDQFMLMLQSAALESGVSIRSLTAVPVVTKPYYFEMPFTIEADGPYYSVLDFFARLGRLSRIINVGDLKLGAVGPANAGKFHMVSGTSVTGTFTITTFFTSAASAGTAERRHRQALRQNGRT